LRKVIENMLTLVCAVVGQKGSEFSVEIEENKLVDALKDAIKQKQVYEFASSKLQLFLAKKDNSKWLDSSALETLTLNRDGYPEGLKHMDPLMWIKNPKYFGENFQLNEGEIHVLVVVPRQAIPLDLQVVEGNRNRVDEWFVDELFSVQKKKRKLDEEESDQSIRYFKMVGFPQVAHPRPEYNRIMIRDAYDVIFKELMDKMKLYLELKSACNLVVTGNPGIGKSYFCLYCIFRLVCGHPEEVKELPLVVFNFHTHYYKHIASTREFVELNEKEVRFLCKQKNVLRLVDGESSQLMGWKGVSILFVSPGQGSLNDYLKVNSSSYIMPVWSLQELQDYNSLLDGELKLAENELISRYDTFGGIPRSIFTMELRINELHSAISSFSPLDIISYVKKSGAVRQSKYSHHILHMVPSAANFLEEYYLDFLSMYILEKLFKRVTEESLKVISKFAIAHENDDSGISCSARGKIYEVLCHRRLKLCKQENLKLRSLSLSVPVNAPNLIVLEDMQIINFKKLDEIHTLPLCLTYCQPTSSTFGALDAFILDGISKICYGLQMTMNLDHGIKAAPLNNFLLWLEGVGIPLKQFYFVFVVPCDKEPQYRSQTIRTLNDLVHQKPGALKNLQQFVTGLDVFVGQP
jgi:Crinkler effector protein N-terminal domain